MAHYAYNRLLQLSPSLREIPSTHIVQSAVKSGRGLGRTTTSSALVTSANAGGPNQQPPSTRIPSPAELEFVASFAPFHPSVFRDSVIGRKDAIPKRFYSLFF